MGSHLGYRGGAMVCKAAKSRNWKSCNQYEPIGRDNKVCVYSGCLNYCEREAMVHKTAARAK